MSLEILHKLQILRFSGGRTKPVPIPHEEITQILLDIGVIENQHSNKIMEKLEIVNGPCRPKGEVVSFDNHKETALLILKCLVVEHQRI